MSSRRDARGRSQEHRVQLLISLGCVIPAILALLKGFMSAKLDHRSANWLDVAMDAGGWILLGALIPIAFSLARRFPIRRSRWKRPLAVHIAGALGLSIAWASLAMVLALLLLHHYATAGAFWHAYLECVLITTPVAVPIYGAVVGSASAYSYFVEAREREADAAQLSEQLANARLSALRMQLNPHFLFNSLNAVLVLVRDKDTEAAERMLELQSEVLRQVLQTDRPQEVPLADELRFIERYLAIEQIRFSDRLHVEWLVDERARSALVPDFIMQPIVENAIRHGIAQQPAEGVVTISARVDEDSLELAVQDNGPGIPPVRQNGVGLSNTTERLGVLFGDVGSITVRSVPDVGTRVVLRFPYRSAG